MDSLLERAWQAGMQGEKKYIALAVPSELYRE
jgi:hypothetical protein